MANNAVAPKANNAAAPKTNNAVELKANNAGPPKTNNAGPPKANNIKNNAGPTKANNIKNNAGPPKANNIKNNAAEPKANNAAPPKANNIKNNAVAPKANNAANNTPTIISKNNISPPEFNKELKTVKYEELPKVEEKTIDVDKLYGKIDSLTESSMKLKIAIGIIVLLIILVICVYFFYYRNKNPVNNVKVYIEKQKSTNSYTMDGDFVDLPKDGYDYSLSFWIYINDYYEEYTYWRHILHKGPGPVNDLIEHKSWNSLTQELKEQSPGIWLHPNKNNIRLAFTTEITKDYCNSNFLENTCIDKEYCMWDGLACKLKNEHAFTKDEIVDYENTDKKLVEYIDLDNIPVKTMVFISFSFEQKNLNIYMNGKLYKTKKFLGTPVFNKDKMHFNLKNTFNGTMYKFRYIPLSLKPDELFTFYEDIPNVKYFPKKYRMKKYAKQFKFKEMISVLFN